MTLSLIKKIFSCPTAPYREGFVLDAMEDILSANKIPYHFDKSKNLIAGWDGRPASRKKIKLAFMAHTDHPGFHITKQTAPNEAEALWLGGAPFSKMKGAKVRIHDPNDINWSITAKIIEVAKDLDSRAGVPLKLKLQPNSNGNSNSKLKLPKGAFGAFNFPGFKLQGKTITTRAADDLAGCVIQLGALLDTYHHQPGRAIAVFTRAEEVGFIGCLAAINDKSFPKVPVISLEASMELPGAHRGKGPVLRLGDRSSLFDTALSQVMLAEAQKLKLSGNFMFQRRIMDGGSCEATALNVLGYQASGLSVPLGNYHNQGSSGPAPEMINLKDVEWARKFCAKMIQNFESHSWQKMMEARLKSLLKENRSKLKYSR